MAKQILLDRRAVLSTAATAVAALPLAAMAPVRFARSKIDPLGNVPICRVADEMQMPEVNATPGTKLKLTWNANAICTVGVPVAAQHGIFAKHGLDVELINFRGSTGQLLEAISTGKADAGVGMALRWLKPLEQGLDPNSDFEWRQYPADLLGEALKKAKSTPSRWAIRSAG